MNLIAAYSFPLVPFFFSSRRRHTRFDWTGVQTCALPICYLVEAIEAPAPPDAAAGNVLGSIMGVTVRDLDESLEFWHDLLGFEFDGDPAFGSDGEIGRASCRERV